MLTSLLIVLVLLKGTRTLYFLQLKEYRLDRLMDFIKYDSGLSQVFNPLGLIAYLLFAFSLIDPALFNLGIIVFMLEILYLNLFKSKLRFTPTAKSLQIFLLYSILVISISQAVNPAVSVLTALVSLLLSVAFFAPITHFIKEAKIRQAKSKISQFPDLKIIAITGSYGKSSTKEFLASILETKFKVLKTPKNINTDIGIANLILQKLDASHQVFVVEMGAYCIGEIANSVKMMPVDYSVMTAVAAQHLSLFGSIENIQTAKSEIVNTLKPTGKLFINTDSKDLKAIKSNFKCQVVTYGTTSDADLMVKNISQTQDFLTFSLDQEDYKTPVTGEHNAVNLAVSIGIAQELGLNHADIKSALFNLVNPEASLTKKIGYNNCLILDDSYNSNLDGFLAAINLINNTNIQSKVLITMGMMELGDYSEEAHKQVAAKADQVFEYIILTKKNILPYFKECKTAKVILLTKPDSIIEFLSDIITNDSVVLIENRLNAKVSNFLFSKK